MGNLFGTDKDTERLIRRVRHQGFDVRVTGRNHLRFRSPSGDLVIGSLTPGKSSGLQLRKRLAKAGYKA